jgi:hypothetical protein
MDFPKGIVPTNAPTRPSVPWDPPSPKTNVRPNSLGAIVRAYKSAVTYRVIALYGKRGASLW